MSEIWYYKQEVGHHRCDILRRFLCEVISETDEAASSNGEADLDAGHAEAQADRQRATITALLVEILRQFLVRNRSKKQYLVLNLHVLIQVK